MKRKPKSNTLADLGGVPGARPLPPMVQILLFQHTKFSKRNHLGSQCPPSRGPLREILDPPLKCSSCLVFNLIEFGMDHEQPKIF